MIIFGTQGGRGIIGEGPSSRVELSLKQKKGRNYPRIKTDRAAVEEIQPGQFFHVQKATIGVASLDLPLRISLPDGFDTYLLRREGEAVSLADAPIIYGATNLRQVFPGEKIEVSKKVFGPAFWSSCDLPPHLYELLHSKTELLIDAANVEGGLFLTYVCGGTAAISREIITGNLELLRDDIIPRVIGKIKINHNGREARLSLVFDPSTGKLLRFVSEFREDEAGVVFYQDPGTRRIARFSFVLGNKTVSDPIWFVMEITRSFYNRFVL
jgi:hypothetical protein